MKKIFFLFAIIFLMNENKYVYSQKDSLFTFSSINKIGDKNISFIQYNHKSFRLNPQNVYSEHWCTLAGIPMGIGAGFIIAYPKDYTPTIKDIRFRQLSYSFFGGIIGGVVGHIFDEFVIPNRKSKNARLTIRGNNITLTCTL